MKGSGAPGNRRRAAVRSPPCGRQSTPMGLCVTLTFLALLIEALVGYPDRLVGAIGHPVTWMGWLLDRLDGSLNHGSASNARRHMSGGTAIFILVAIFAGLAYVGEGALVLLRL